MKTITKLYDMKQTITCAPQCPFLSIVQREVKSEEVIGYTCNRYNVNLKTMEGEDRVIRSKDCKITKLELIFEFEE